MPLVINGLGDGHTDRHIHIPTHEPKQFQETRRAWPSRAWFKKQFLKTRHLSGLKLYKHLYTYLITDSFNFTDQTFAPHCSTVSSLEVNPLMIQ